MKLVKSLLASAVIAGSLGGVAVAQDDKVTIGVSVPAADHGWTGGVNYFAQQAIERLGTTYPNVEFVFASAPDAPKQIADIEDMVSTRGIDALVILPGDPDAMTSAIKQVKDAGKFVTVVDRQLSIDGVENLYVAGDNPGLGANSAEYFKTAMPDGGNIVILRGLPIPIDAQRFDAFMAGIEGSNIVNDLWEALVALKHFNQSIGVLGISAQWVISSHGLHDFHKDICFVTTNINCHEDISLEIIVEASLRGD